MELLLELLWLLLPEGVLPLKLGSFFPVAGPVDTYSLLLLLFVVEPPGVVLPGVVDDELLPGVLLLPGVVMLVELFVALPLMLMALPPLAVQAPFAAKV